VFTGLTDNTTPFDPGGHIHQRVSIRKLVPEFKTFDQFFHSWVSIEKLIGAHYFQCIDFWYTEFHALVEFIFDDPVADRLFFVISMGLDPNFPPMQ
jgi:hypothetical protein